jgi:hypothetical protein
MTDEIAAGSWSQAVRATLARLPDLVNLTNVGGAPEKRACSGKFVRTADHQVDHRS